ncbi:hypothetical protein TKK_0000147 [Trichogramma kaykai]
MIFLNEKNFLFFAASVEIVKQPPPIVNLRVGEPLLLLCSAIGIPIPIIHWTYNWKKVPTKCSVSSINGTGILLCPNMKLENQGLYTCEGANNIGSIISTPDTIVIVEESKFCPYGTFNSAAKNVSKCILCFCFGITSDCTEADLFMESQKIVLAFDKIEKIIIKKNEKRNNHYELLRHQLEMNNLRYSHKKFKNDTSYDTWYIHSTSTMKGNYLKSFGGHLYYDIEFKDNIIDVRQPMVMFVGNSIELHYIQSLITTKGERKVKIKLTEENWFKYENQTLIIATREDVMMVLQNLTDIYIK